MEVVYKVVRRNLDKLLSISTNIPKFTYNYKKPVQSQYGLFVFENPYWAKKFLTSLTKDSRIIKGITDEIKPITVCLFEVIEEDHEKFWNFYFQNNKLPDWTDMIHMNLYPFIAPYGSVICHTFQMTHRFINIDEEIKNYERNKDNADRQTERS